MKITLNRVSENADTSEIINAINSIVDKLNTGLLEIDEENLSDSILKKLNTGGK